MKLNEITEEKPLLVDIISKMISDGKPVRADLPGYSGTPCLGEIYAITYRTDKSGIKSPVVQLYVDIEPKPQAKRRSAMVTQEPWTILASSFDDRYTMRKDANGIPTLVLA